MFIYLSIYLSTVIKKKEFLPFATTWMDLQGIRLSEINQTEEDKYHVISLIYGIKRERRKKNELRRLSVCQRQKVRGKQSG